MPLATKIATHIPPRGISGIITNVQYGTITLGNGVGASATATITSAPTTRSCAVFLGITDTSNDFTTLADRFLARVELTNATTVTAFTNTASGGTVIVGFAVITFSTTKSVQTGTIAVSAATSNTATITSVNTTKAAVLFLGSIADVTADSDSRINYGRITLTNATTLTATKASAAAGSATLGFVVVESL